MKRQTILFALPFFLFTTCSYQTVFSQSAKGEQIIEQTRSSELVLSNKTAHVFLAKPTDAKVIGKRSVIASGVHVSESSGILLYSSVGGTYTPAGYNLAVTSEGAEKKKRLSAGEGVGHDLPTEYALFQNYPNPFNPITVIRYQIPVTSVVKLTIYNTLGQKVGMPVDEVQSTGYKVVAWDASVVPSGLYFYKLTAGSFTEVKKMMLVK